jgi:hypothetical protein
VTRVVAAADDDVAPAVTAREVMRAMAIEGWRHCIGST